MNITTTTTAGAGGSADDDDPHLASLEDVYEDGVLVLIAGGSDQRDPGDPVDRHVAVVDEGEPVHGTVAHDVTETGPAWEARHLYTSAEFEAAKAFATRLSRCDGSPPSRWAILDAEGGVCLPWEKTTPSNKTVTDLGADETNVDHHVDPRGVGSKRRPDGREVVTEMDQWAKKVAVTLMRWIASFRQWGRDWEHHMTPEYDAKTLVIAAPEEWIAPLRERGVFEYGIARISGDPNAGLTFPLETRELGEDSPLFADGESDRIAWLSDATSQLRERPDAGEQHEMDQWTSHDERACDRCDAAASDVADDGGLLAVGGGVYCEDCHPDQCARCGAWTHETGLGTYPLCSDCQTEYGGQIRDPVETDDTESTTLTEYIEVNT